VIGAFDGEHLVGFALAFLGQEKQRLTLAFGHVGGEARLSCLCLGYQPETGPAREGADERNRTVTWTFDPLQSLNAYLNIAKLG